MTTKDTKVENLPAFPKDIHSDFGGMELRDYFAAAALPAVLSHYLAANGNGCAADHALRNVPALAYRYADAMLKERAQ